MEGEESNQSIMEDQPGAKRAKLEASETDRLLNFATAADEFELSLKRHKLPRDPMSHRIIEKRRRDRMNNCLADLSRLIPSSYHKQGQGRIEKTEIIEMAIKHINLLQQRLDDIDRKVCKDEKAATQSTSNEHHCCSAKFYMGFKEAQDEVMRFLVEVESVNPMDPFCKKIMNHLENASKKFITEPVPRCAPLDDVEKSDVTGMETDNSQQGFLQRSAFYPASTGGSGIQGDSSLTIDNKHRDKHLRSLLAEQQHSMVSSNNGSGSMSETSSGSQCLVPLFSYTNHMHGMGAVTDQNGMGSSGYVSDLSNLEKTSPSGSTSSRDNVYKFKHNITKRFSQEGHHHHMHHHIQHHHHHHKHGQPIDTSSSTSSRDLEDDQSQLKWKSNKHKTRQGVTSNLYQDEIEGHSGGNNSVNSDECNSESVSNECSRRWSSCKAGGQNTNHSSDSGSSSVALPGFILHPQGTHYMPISVHNTNIAGLFEHTSEHDGPMVFHPISIPVHFRRPVISMPNITICTHMSSQRRGDQSVKE
ncbi:hypothetical protein BsWGS_13955 [Bradybaena similaris]